MKTIEEKAKAYDKAIERAKECHIDGLSLHQPVKDVIEHIFPELKETKDERIIIAIKEAVNCYWVDDSQAKTAIFTWLEKQGEPKFKMGDLVIDKQGIVHQIANVIENVTYHTYGYDIVGGGYFNDNTEGVRLWTIADAKDGDVLACNEEILLFKSYSVQGHISLYCWYNGQTNNFHSKEVTDASLTTRNKICPATKEQRDLLFQKMKEAGYEWDVEKKELKKIVNEEQIKKNLQDNSFCRMFERKPAWSEEDEHIRKWIISDIDKLYLLGKKSSCIADRENNWLKSLGPHSAWKPSEERIEILKKFRKY